MIKETSIVSLSEFDRDEESRASYLHWCCAFGGIDENVSVVSKSYFFQFKIKGLVCLLVLFRM